MPKTTFTSDTVINLLLRGVPFVPPASIYLGLFTVAPTVMGGGVEVSGGAYIRQGVTWSIPNNGLSNNTSQVDFPVATGNWGVIVAFALFDNLAGGNMLYFASLNAPRDVQINDQVQYPVGQLTVTEV